MALIHSKSSPLDIPDEASMTAHKGKRREMESGWIQKLLDQYIDIAATLVQHKSSVSHHSSLKERKSALLHVELKLALL